jgi:hypothetical protein
MRKQHEGDGRVRSQSEEEDAWLGDPLRMLKRFWCQGFFPHVKFVFQVV